MENNFSYANLYKILDELHIKLKNEDYPSRYLEALDEAKNSILVLELLNLSRPHTFT